MQLAARVAELYVAYKLAMCLNLWQKRSQPFMYSSLWMREVTNRSAALLAGAPAALTDRRCSYDMEDMDNVSLWGIIQDAHNNCADKDAEDFRKVFGASQLDNFKACLDCMWVGWLFTSQPFWQQLQRCCRAALRYHRLHCWVPCCFQCSERLPLLQFTPCCNNRGSNGGAPCTCCTHGALMAAGLQLALMPFGIHSTTGSSAMSRL